MFNIVILLTLVSIVRSHDVIVGTNTEGRKIYDEVRHASPAIWRQAENVTVSTTDAEVISRIVITDLRPDKDGDVQLVEGGEGQKNVTIQLKSPTVLRGYDFQIQVFVVPEDKFKATGKDVPTASQTRVQRNHEKPSFNPPATIFANKQETATTNSNATSISDDTKINDDKFKTTNKDSENVDGYKPSSSPVPFLGNGPHAFDIPAVTASHTGEAAKDTHDRHSRAAFNPEIPEESQDPQKKIAETEARSQNSSTHRPTLLSRQGTFNRPAVSTTNKPEDVDNVKRDARDTEHDKSDVNATTKENSFSQHPATISRQNLFDKSAPVSTTNKPADATKNARDTEHDKKNADTTPEHNSSTHYSHYGGIISQQGLFDSHVYTTGKPDETIEKRVARDTEHDKKINATTPDEKKSYAQHPAFISRQGTFNIPSISVSSTTNKPDDTTEKRNARDIEHDKKSDESTTFEEKTSADNPAIIARQGLFNRPIRPTTHKPETTTNEKRESRDTEHKKSDDTTPKDNTSAEHPALVLRQGTFNIPSLSVSTTTNKPDDTTEKRNARDTEHDKNDNTRPGEKSSTQHPATISRQGLFNRPTTTSTTNKPDDATGQRTARDTEHGKKTDDSTTTKEKTSVDYPAIIARQGLFNRPIRPTTHKPETTTNEKRESRDTEHKKSDDTTPKDNNSAEHPALVVRQGTFNIPSLSVSTTTNKPDHTTEKRHARDTEHEKTNDDSANERSTPHPAIISRQGSFNRPTTTSTTSKPDDTTEKRNARDVEHNNTDSNTTPKADVEGSRMHPAHPRISIDSKPLVDDKTYTPTPAQVDQTMDSKIDNPHPYGHFVPPAGYKRVVAAIPDEKERVARDVENDKEATPPKLNGKDEASTTTAKPLADNNDGFRLLPIGINIPKSINQPLETLLFEGKKKDA